APFINHLSLLLIPPPPIPPLFPYPTLFRSPASMAATAWPRVMAGPFAMFRVPEAILRERSPAWVGSGAATPMSTTTTFAPTWRRSEEHTSELQSRFDLVCRLLLEKKKDRRQ